MKIFKRIRLNSDGFSHVESVLGVLVVAVLAIVGVRVLTASHAATTNKLLYSSWPLVPLNISSVDSSSNTTTILSAKKGFFVAGTSPTRLFSWGADQSNVFFVGNKIKAKNKQNSIYSVAYNGKKLKAIAKKVTDSTDNITELAVSEAAQKILYVVTPDANNQSKFYTMNFDGSDRTNIYTTNLGATGVDVSWSPNGKQILFASGHTLANGSEQTELYVMSATGTGLVNLPVGAGINPLITSRNPWSSDSSQIVYVANNQQSNDDSIDVINASGKATNGNGSARPKVLLNASGTIYGYPQWSPNGQNIAFCYLSYANTCYSLNYTANSSSTPTPKLLGSDFANVQDFDWSPDSSSLVFAFSNPNSPGPLSLKTESINGGALQTVANNAYGFEWSVQ